MNLQQKITALLLVATTFPLPGFCQSSNYNESNYSLLQQGLDSTNRYTRQYQNNASPAYRLTAVYTDSTYTQVLSKTFYKEGIEDGPTLIYLNGNIALQGAHKNGKWDGERLTYIKNVIVQKAYFNEGVKTGTWEEFNLQGQLKRKIIYDSSGAIASDVKY